VRAFEQFVDLFDAIGDDRDNRVVILTGTGDVSDTRFDQRSGAQTAFGE